jgi:hypothetical protein
VKDNCELSDIAAKFRIEIMGRLFLCIGNMTPTLKYFSFSPLTAVAWAAMVRERKKRKNCIGGCKENPTNIHSTTGKDSA